MASSKKTQGAAFPLSGASSTSSLSYEAGRDLRVVMMEQVEADIALLMARQVSLAFKDFATTTVVAAYPGFQESLLRLPSKELLKHTIAKSVWITCFTILSFTFCWFTVLDSTCSASFLHGAFRVAVISQHLQTQLEELQSANKTIASLDAAWKAFKAAKLESEVARVEMSAKVADLEEELSLERE